jgi:hypothetical protein
VQLTACNLRAHGDTGGMERGLLPSVWGLSTQQVHVHSYVLHHGGGLGEHATALCTPHSRATAFCTLRMVTRVTRDGGNLAISVRELCCVSVLAMPQRDALCVDSLCTATLIHMLHVRNRTVFSNAAP